MNYDQLSEEAKSTIKVMVEHCINHGLCMGMDEGIACFDSGKKHEFRQELEAFSQQQ
jgi:hypothetical protein